jgi:signal transduction histidine kinase
MAERSREELLSVMEDIRRTVVHDLRNPLAVIVGQVEMMKCGIGGPKNLDAIERNADRLTEMLNKLADRVNKELA